MRCDVLLRDVVASDLPIFFEHQRDPIAVRMAAFTAADPDDQTAFMDHWTRVLADDGITVQTITRDGVAVGQVLAYGRAGKREVSFWFGRDHWGQGIATTALSLFLEQVGERPLFARAARDNRASIRVLERCGFVIAGEDTGFAHARGEEITEVCLTLA